jgi:hypothetical protein
MSDMYHQVADTFGGTGVVSNFRGPYSTGPPQADLAVHTRSLTDSVGVNSVGSSPLVSSW